MADVSAPLVKIALSATNNAPQKTPNRYKAQATHAKMLRRRIAHFYPRFKDIDHIKKPGSLRTNPSAQHITPPSRNQIAKAEMAHG